MKPENQRIKIAEACGWELVEQDIAVPPDGQFPTVMPDYLNDLNAMHEAEKTLDMCSENQQSRERGIKYIHLLGAITDHGWKGFATAAQRAEAFLKTLGLWEDDQ